MRDADIQKNALFSMVSPDARVPKDHSIRTMIDAALKDTDQDFDALYSSFGRDSISPEKLLRAQLLMAFYTIRSERQLVEQINYNLLFLWFVGFSMDDEVWDHSTFTKSRDLLLDGEAAQCFFTRVLAQTGRAGLLSKEHCSVDGPGPAETGQAGRISTKILRKVTANVAKFGTCRVASASSGIRMDLSRCPTIISKILELTNGTCKHFKPTKRL